MKNVATKIVAIIAIAIIVMSANTGCRKDYLTKSDKTVKVALHYAVQKKGGKILDTEGAIVGPNTVIYCDTADFVIYWLEPADTIAGLIAKGIYTTKNPLGITIYTSAVPENGIHYKGTVGTYVNDVSGNYLGFPFSYPNIQVIFSAGTTPPTNPNTSPVKIHGMTLSGGWVDVSLAVDKTAINSQITTGTWFYVQQVNGQNFVLTNTTNVSTDSIYYSVTFPDVTGSVVEFNDGGTKTTGGSLWQTPSAAPQSILFPGTGSYWQFTYANNGTTATLTAPNGTVVLSLSLIGVQPYYGNDGDLQPNSYRYRWSGLSRFYNYKNVPTTPAARWKMGPTGTWNYLTVSFQGTSGNGNFYKSVLPAAASTGEIHMQFGQMVGSTFVVDPYINDSQFDTDPSSNPQDLVTTQ